MLRHPYLEEIVARARRLAAEQPFEPAEVLRWLREGSEEERITALAMMQAKRELRDFDAALAAIEHSRSAFEQYHALLLAAEMTDDLAQRSDDGWPRPSRPSGGCALAATPAAGSSARTSSGAWMDAQTGAGWRGGAGDGSWTTR